MAQLKAGSTINGIEIADINKIGILSNLTTTDKSNLVNAVNEVKSDSDTHIANDAPTNDVHGLKTLFQNQQFANLIKNGDFASWSQGDTAAPDGWKIYLITITNKKLAPDGTGWHGLRQDITDVVKPNTKYTVVVRSAVADVDNEWFLNIFNGAEDINAGCFTTTGNTVVYTFTTASSFTTVQVQLRTNSDTASGLDIANANIVLVEGELPVAFANHPNDQHLKAVDYQDSAGTNYEYGLLKLQCGVVSATSDTAVNGITVNISFPKTFTKILGAWANAKDGTSLGGKNCIVAIKNQSNTGCTLVISVADATNFSSAETKNYDWFALGVG